MKVWLMFRDGTEISGVFRGVSGEMVDLGEGTGRIELARVKRMRLEFCSQPPRIVQTDRPQR
jgi:hypothetical protein